MDDQANTVLKDDADEFDVGPWRPLYDHLAGAYDFVMASNGWHRIMDRFSLEGLDPASDKGGSGRGSLLDVGCGTGRLVKQAAEEGFEAYGIDPMPKMVEEARVCSGLGSDRLRIGLAEKLPFEDGRFDIVLECGALLHVPDITAAAGEMVRVTRPGGLIRILDYAPPPTDGAYTRFVGRWAERVGYQVHDFRKAFEASSRCESHQVIGRGGYLQRFDFRKPL